MTHWIVIKQGARACVSRGVRRRALSYSQPCIGRGWGINYAFTRDQDLLDEFPTRHCDETRKATVTGYFFLKQIKLIISNTVRGNVLNWGTFGELWALYRKVCLLYYALTLRCFLLQLTVLQTVSCLRLTTEDVAYDNLGYSETFHSLQLTLVILILTIVEFLP